MYLVHLLKSFRAFNVKSSNTLYKVPTERNGENAILEDGGLLCCVALMAIFVHAKYLMSICVKYLHWP